MKKIFITIVFLCLFTPSFSQEFYNCKVNKYLLIESDGKTTDIPIADDFKFSFIWDWQKKEASFKGIPMVTVNLGGLDRIEITRQSDEMFMIENFWYKVTFADSKFYYSGNDRHGLTAIVGECDELSVFLH